MRRLLVSVFLAVMIIGGAFALLQYSKAEAQSSARFITVLSSSARTATTTSGDYANLGENAASRGAYLFLNVTGILTNPLITVSVQAKDYTSGTYRGVFTATAGVSSTATYLLYPGVGTAANQVTEVRSYPMPPLWRVVVSHNNTNPITYSVSMELVP